MGRLLTLFCLWNSLSTTSVLALVRMFEAWSAPACFALSSSRSSCSQHHHPRRRTRLRDGPPGWQAAPWLYLQVLEVADVPQRHVLGVRRVLQRDDLHTTPTNIQHSGHQHYAACEPGPATSRQARTSLRVNGSPVMRSVQFFLLMFSSCTASIAYTLPDGLIATTCVLSLNSCTRPGKRVG